MVTRKASAVSSQRGPVVVQQAVLMQRACRGVEWTYVAGGKEGWRREEKGRRLRVGLLAAAAAAAVAAMVAEVAAAAVAAAAAAAVLLENGLEGKGSETKGLEAKGLEAKGLEAKGLEGMAVAVGAVEAVAV
jgi:hypothetical protein